MDPNETRSLFIKALKDIKESKKLSYATISRLIGVSMDKIYNIIHKKSTPKIEDLQKFLVSFPEHQDVFANIEGLDLKSIEQKYEEKEQDIISILNDKLALYEETKTAQRETIESLKAEIARLKEKIVLQEKLLSDKEKQ